MEDKKEKGVRDGSQISEMNFDVPLERLRVQEEEHAGKQE